MNDEDEVIPISTKPRRMSTKAIREQAEIERLAEVGRAVERGGALAVQQDEDDEPGEETALDRVAELLSAVTAGGKITVWAHGIRGREHCGELTPDQLEAGGFDLLRQQWGPGDYELMLYGPNPGNGNRYSLRKRMRVVLRAALTPMAAQSSTGGGEMAQMMRLIAENQQRMNEALIALANKPAAPAPDPMAGITAAVGLMAQMREVMGGNTKPPAPTPLAETLAMMRELREAAKELAPGDKSSEENLVELAGPVIDLVKQTLAQRNTPAPGLPMMAVPQTLAYATPPPTPPVNPTATTTPEDDEMRKFNALKLVLLEHAKRGMDASGKPIAETVEKVAEMIYQNAPDAVLEILTTDKWWETLITIAPEFAAHETFLIEARLAVLVILAEEAEDDEPGIVPAPPPADGGQPAG